MSFMPLVSIIIPVYNGANYLREAIDSALSQDYKSIEIIVINDGSSDQGATESIAKEYGDKVKYLSKPNGGVSTALNAGIATMKGDYFSWLSHDDLYRPDKISTQVKRLSQLDSPENFIIYSDYEIKYEANNKTVPVFLKDTTPEAFRYRVAVGNDLNGCTMLIPKSAFEKFGLFNEKMRAVQDYDMWFRLANEYQFLHVPEPLVIGRVHGEQVGVRMSARVRQENLEFRKNCIDALSVIELENATKQKLPYSFLKIAEIFLKRRLHPTAIHAVALSLKNLSHFNTIEKVKFLLMLTATVLRNSLIAIYFSTRTYIANLRTK